MSIIYFIDFHKLIRPLEMANFLQKYFPFISIALLVALVVSLFLAPETSSGVSILLLVLSLGITVFFTFQKHIQPLKQGQITRAKFTRNVLLDMLGFLFAVAAASYVGGVAGTRLGASFGLWAGLIAGMLVAFLAAWGVLKLWGLARVYLMG